MKLKTIRIEDIIPYENNPRFNDDAVDAVKKSIQEYGFKVPMVLDSNNVIVCGHTRYRAAKALGLEEVPCVIASDLSEKQIKAFRIADNKTSDFSIFDNKKLVEELGGLEDLYTGFDWSELEELSVLDEKYNDPLNEDYDLQYEVTFKSCDKDKITAIQEAWKEIETEKK